MSYDEADHVPVTEKNMDNLKQFENDFIPTEAIVPDYILAMADNELVVADEFDDSEDPSASARIGAGVSLKLGSRQVQQDCARIDDVGYYNEKKLFLAMMCDGMGGMSGGEIASNLCVSKMFEAFHAGDVQGNIPAFFRRMIDVLDKEVYNLTDDSGEHMQSGSTLTAVVIEGNNLYWLSVGDSRIYLKRADEMVRVTVDYNYGYLLEGKVKNGQITREQADSDPHKDALISFIGIGGVNYYDINPNPVELADGDTLLLCSDGLYRALSDSDIKSIMDDFSFDESVTAEALTCAALSVGKKNQDNTTAVIVRYHKI